MSGTRRRYLLLRAKVVLLHCSSSENFLFHFFLALWLDSKVLANKKKSYGLEAVAMADSEI